MDGEGEMVLLMVVLCLIMDKMFCFSLDKMDLCNLYKIKYVRCDRRNMKCEWVLIYIMKIIWMFFKR